MGTTTSKVSPLAPAFERMTTWDIKAARQMLQDYKDKDLDFGLDAQGLGELLRGDKEWAESIIDAFGSSTGIVNALAFVCGACLVSSGPALEKTENFDGTEQISMDEMVSNIPCIATYITRSFLLLSIHKLCECQETTVSTEDDDHSDVVGIDDEPPQNSAAPVDDTRIQNVPAEEEIGELVAPLDTETTAVFDQQHNVLDGQEVDAEAALAEIAQAEAPQEPLAIEGGEDEEDTYEQDFAQETPQETPRPVDDVCPDQSVENDEFTDERDLGAATDMLKPTLTEGANGITTQDINESGAGVNEDRIRTTTILQDSADDASNKQFDDTGVSLS
ncbi:hypothetical protein BBO99_00005500 [Phytophthora kernoviae]|uniref:Uncharacterized protein n=2 Tax=Phytophthora kernoviae TaxID=325452 RepID=A0A421FJP5_9STRA|nr:hypothetical protein G195_009765 [Phytophthora kernoviae 00238/432]KAG2511604.1 hypothetical protein JM16_008222 [Phytophthora kernoviae]KAG2515359.1 hypothetical protein JM18_008184 [Phytophthora kernoviae]RLN46045.1 hypothetical protein BBI17_005579 [Phytophthora kernoviae]RLN79130.1 hypothetical protein BBO99_00005500 [Phytophthora kernoviae]